jgi:flagellar biosynthetic protein FliQ
MNVSMAAQLMRDALIKTAVVSAPILIVSLVVGLIIGIIQTTTSVQEQTLSFVPKIFAIFAVILLLAVPGFAYLSEYTRQLFMLIVDAAR